MTQPGKSKLVKGPVVILREDKQHGAFVRRLLIKLGRNKREIRELPPPANIKQGRAAVLEHLAQEVDQHRKGYCSTKSRRLVLIIDADDFSTVETKRQIQSKLTEAKLPAISSGEGVVQLIPKREIETWLDFLEGKSISEDDRPIQRKQCEGSIADPVQKFVDFVRQPHLMSDDVLPSLKAAVGEVRTEL